MALSSKPWHRQRLRRALIGGLVALLTCLSVPVAHARTLGQLRADRRDAVHSLKVAKAILRQRALDLADAKRVYRAAHADFQRTVASLYMLVEPIGDTDPETLGRLRQGIQDATWQIDVANVERERALLEVSKLDGDIAFAEATAYAQTSQRTQQASTQAQQATIACPVGQASAIYNDFSAPRPGGPHRGIDIPAPHGTPVIASWYADVIETPVGGWMGRGVILRDGANNTWSYAHLSAVTVQVGQRIARGQTIGAVGSTGNSTGPHLHFEVHARGLRPVNPYSLVSASCGVYDSLSYQDRVRSETDAPATDDNSAA